MIAACLLLTQEPKPLRGEQPWSQSGPALTLRTYQDGDYWIYETRSKFPSYPSDKIPVERTTVRLHKIDENETSTFFKVEVICDDDNIVYRHDHEVRQDKSTGDLCYVRFGQRKIDILRVTERNKRVAAALDDFLERYRRRFNTLPGEIVVPGKLRSKMDFGFVETFVPGKLVKIEGPFNFEKRWRSFRYRVDRLGIMTESYFSPSIGNTVYEQFIFPHSRSSRLNITGTMRLVETNVKG